MPAGTVIAFAGTTEPTGWLLCDGRTLQRADYPDLFAAIGSTYGAGNGTTTFLIPDLRGRAIVGKDDMGGLAATRLTPAGGGIDGLLLGAAGGAESRILTVAQMPAHTHLQDAHTHLQTAHGHAPTDPGHYHTGGYSGLVIPGRWGNEDTGVNHTGRYEHSDTGAAATNFASKTSTVKTGITLAQTTAVNQSTVAVNQSTGGGGAHSVTQPSIVLNYLIKL